MTVKIVTDSTADLPDDVIHELGITVVPLLIHIDEETFEDGVTISLDGFYNLLATGNVFPKTSAPSSGMFIEAYERLAQQTDEIISIHISTKLSAVFAAALVARDGIDTPCRIEVIDSLSASIGLGLLVVQAATMARDGANLEAIVHVTEASIPRTQFFGVLDSLEYLHKGGRIGNATRFIGTLLNIKPLVYINHETGLVEPGQPTRTRRRALEALYEGFFAQLCTAQVGAGRRLRVAVLHGGALQEAEAMAERIRREYDPIELIITITSPVLGVHTGPRAIALCGHVDE